MREPQGFLACAIALVALLAAPGCGTREPASERAAATALPLRVLADTASGTRLAVPPAAEARAWLSRVTREPPARIAPADPLAAPPPIPPAETLSAAPIEPESLIVDDGLRAPVPIGEAILRAPASRGRGVPVDLDVRVDEQGEVTDALWAGGSADSAEVRAAIECALGMRFHPALQAGRPVAVWCRQRFAFERGSARRIVDAGGE